MRHEMENYSWEIVQNMIEREVNAAFKLRVDPVLPSKKEIKRIIRDTVKGERLKEQGHTPSYIEWMIWQTKNNVPAGLVQYQGKDNEKD